MEPSRQRIVHVLSIVSLVAILGGLPFLSACKARPTPTPTPTKTPTPPPLVTPTPIKHAAAPSTPTTTATSTVTPVPTASSNDSTPTPTATATTVVATATFTTAITTTTTVTPSTTAAPTPTPVPTIAIGADINPLTGLKVDQARLNRRPLGVKIPNFPAEARPQSGLSLADVVIEHEAEAYLTRFTAIFLGNDVTPTLGPIRSMRLIDSELMPIFKAVLVASGGHPDVKKRIVQGKPWAAGYKRIICPEDPFLGDGGTMRRIPKAGRRYELTLYSDTTSLWNLCTKRGINQRQDFHNMWVFSESPPAGGRDATHLKIVYKPNYSVVEYRYDPPTHTYKRFDMGQPLMDELTGKQIAPSNVLVLFVNHVDTDIAADQHDPNHTWYSISIQLWGEGPARLLRDGKVYDCKWMRVHPQKPDDSLIIVDADGNKLPFRPGPTWIQLVRLNASVQID